MKERCETILEALSTIPSDGIEPLLSLLRITVSSHPQRRILPVFSVFCNRKDAVKYGLVRLDMMQKLCERMGARTCDCFSCVDIINIGDGSKWLTMRFDTQGFLNMWSQSKFNPYPCDQVG